MTALPRYFALCGHPKSGKTEVAKILHQVYGVQPIDSGLPLREIGMKYFGLTRHQVFTQEGKAEYVEILGRSWQVREFLGELGNQLEAMHGEWVMPFMVTRTLPATGSYADASVRKTQGGFYRQSHGVVIQVVNPEVGPSPYAFDKFDESLIDFTLINDALSKGASRAEGLHDLEGKVRQLVEGLVIKAA